MYSHNIYTIFAYTSWLAAHDCCAVQAMALSRAPGFRAGLSSPPLDLAVHLAEMQGCGPSSTLTGFRGARGCWLSLLLLLLSKSMVSAS